MLPWLALVFPFLVGLGTCEIFLFHAAITFFAGCRKHQPEAWRGRFLSTAFAMGLAWGVQMVLFSGLLATALHMKAMIQNGSFLQADTITALYDGHIMDVLPIQPILYTVPAITLFYWIMLNIVNQFERRRKSWREMKAEMQRVDNIIRIEDNKPLMQGKCYTIVTGTYTMSHAAD